MNYRDEVKQSLDDFVKKLNLDPIEFDEEDSAMIVLDNNIPIIMELNDDIRGLILSVVLGELPPEGHREQILTQLLQANFYWQGTEGGTIGMDEETGLICLCYMLTYPLENPSDFSLVIEKLANVGEYWIHQLKLEEPDTESKNLRI